MVWVKKNKEILPIFEVFWVRKFILHIYFYYYNVDELLFKLAKKVF